MIDDHSLFYRNWLARELISPDRLMDDDGQCQYIIEPNTPWYDMEKGRWTEDPRRCAKSSGWGVACHIHEQYLLPVPPLAQIDSFVYFVRAGSRPYVKIGTAKNPTSRLSSIQTGCPDKVQIAALMRGDVELESRLHTIFGGRRHRREWFRIPPDDMPWALTVAGFLSLSVDAKRAGYDSTANYLRSRIKCCQSSEEERIAA